MHLIFGGRGRLLVAYILAAWIGFAIGQAVGDVMSIRALVVGPTNVLPGVIGALLASGLAVFLAGQRLPRFRRE
jgi:hypothetical protein